MHITVTCSQTNVELDFELPGDDASLPVYWSRTLHVDCPACGAVHAIPYRDAYVLGVMSEFTCVPLDVREATFH